MSTLKGKKIFESASLESLLVLAGINLGDNLLQLSFSLTLREVVHIVVLRCNSKNINKFILKSIIFKRNIFVRMKLITLPDQPLRLDICAGPDVVLGGEDEFIVENPLGFVVQARGRMKLDNLVILWKKGLMMSTYCRKQFYISKTQIK